MTPPRPAAIRLATQAVGAAPPAPLFGLTAWTAEADAVAVLLDATEADVRDVATVASQLPEPAKIASGAPIFVLPAAVRVATGWRRILGQRRVAVPLDVRCGALLVRGYVNIGSAREGATEVVWAHAP
jgi:hypothetical protein